LLKAPELNDPLVAEKLRMRIVTAGIAPDRVELVGSRHTPTWADHMHYYDRLDIALDPIERQSGTTTTCDTLWMGVPVVSLLGDKLATRMGGTILTGIGRSEWIADNKEAYVEIVRELCRDIPLRRRIRANQRADMRAGPICDFLDLTRALEQAYRAMLA